MSDLGKRLLVGRALSQRAARRDPAAQAHRAAGVRLATRCRPTRTPPRRSCSSSRSAGPRCYTYAPWVAADGRGRLLRRGRVLPAERARLPERRRRLRGRHHQPRAAGRRVRGVARCSSTTSSPSPCRSRRPWPTSRRAVPGDRRRTRWRGPSRSSSLIVLHEPARASASPGRRSRSRSTASSSASSAWSGYALFRIARVTCCSAESAELDGRRRGHLHAAWRWSS